MSRPIRIVVYCVLLLLAIVWLADRAAPPPPAAEEAERDVTTEQMEATLAALRRDAAADGRLVIVLGDSSLLGHLPLAPDETLAVMLERGGEQAGIPIRVIAYDGFDAVAYYMLVDEIAALRPAAVVLTANLQSFTDAWFRRVRMKHPQLAAFVHPPRVPEAIRLPLELAGVTDASLLVKPVLRAIGATDLTEKIDGYRTRVRERLDAILVRGAKTAIADAGTAHAAEPPQPGAMPSLVPMPAPMIGGRGARQRNLGRPVVPPGNRGQVLTKGAFMFTDLYPLNLERDQSTVRVLAAAVRDLAARDVRTIVMLAPLHLQALRMTGAYTQRNLPQAVRVIEDAVAAGGGTSLDLTEILPEESFFADRYTHFTADGNRRVADRMLEEVRGAVESAAAARP